LTVSAGAGGAVSDDESGQYLEGMPIDVTAAAAACSRRPGTSPAQMFYNLLLEKEAADGIVK